MTYGKVAVALLALNAVLMGTFAFSAITQTKDVQPWVTVAEVVGYTNEN